MLKLSRRVSRDSFKPSERQVYFIILLIGLIHGLIYVFLIPPWSHYDEPGHFEYVWMIATRPEIPSVGEFDAPIRRVIMDSMIRNDFYKFLGPAPDLANLPDPVPIGVTQVGDPPIYYWLVSLPVRALRSEPIETQLYAGRLVSLIFLLATIFVARKFAQEISGDHSPLRWLLPFCVVTIPGLVDVMTALNNDTAAIFVYSVFLLIGVKAIRRGLTWKYALLLLVCTVVGFFMKSSNWVIFIAFPITLLLGMTRWKRVWLSVAILGVAVAAAVLALFQWDDPAMWIRDTNQDTPAHVRIQQPGIGSYALQITTSPEKVNRLHQILPSSQAQSIRGMPVTIGAWMWADQPGQANLPQISSIGSSGDKQTTPAQVVQLSREPRFFAYTMTVSKDSRRPIFLLNPFENLSQLNTIYYSRLVLAAGEFNPDVPPDLDPGSSSGTWSGVQFTNLVRNPEGLGGWPRLRPAVITLLGKIDYRLEESIGWTISLLDLKGTSWFVQASIERLFRTFWATFGWGSIPLIGSKPYRALVVISILGLLGAVGAYLRQPNKSDLLVAGWLVANIMMEFMYALYTGVSMGSITGRAFLPVARYIYPTILAIMAILCVGWLTLIRLLPIKYQSAGFAILIVFFLILNTVSIISIRTYWG